jgi:lipoate-protein ligase A
VDGLKFSGNAFCFRKGRALHHGTLLLNTDLERLDRYLGSMFGKIETHAIRSVPAAVANLELGVEEVSAALKKGFETVYGVGEVFQLVEAAFDEALLRPLEEKQASNDWKFGATPGFSLEQGGVRLEVVKGMVTGAAGEGAGRFLDTPFSVTAFSLFCDVD